VTGYEEFVVEIRARQPGDTVTLTVQRDGREFEVDVVLDSTEG
jgi:S1-C subfamily serine protease